MRVRTMSSNSSVVVIQNYCLRTASSTMPATSASGRPALIRCSIEPAIAGSMPARGASSSFRSSGGRLRSAFMMFVLTNVL